MLKLTSTFDMAGKYVMTWRKGSRVRISLMSSVVWRITVKKLLKAWKTELLRFLMF